MGTIRRFSFILTVALALGLAGPAAAFLAGDGKGKPERDCYIGLDGYDQSDLSPINKKGTKSGIVCTDCDPACDLDGVDTANGSCTFSIAACVNQAGVEGCDPASRETKKTAAKAKSKAGKLDLSSTLPSDGSSACSAFVDFVVPTKKNGKKTGKGKVTLKATKKTDKDVFQFRCEPRPEGEACPGGSTTSTTLDGTTTTTTTVTTTITTITTSTTSTSTTTSSTLILPTGVLPIGVTTTSTFFLPTGVLPIGVTTTSTFFLPTGVLPIGVTTTSTFFLPTGVLPIGVTTTSTFFLPTGVLPIGVTTTSTFFLPTGVLPIGVTTTSTFFLPTGVLPIGVTTTSTFFLPTGVLPLPLISATTTSTIPQVLP